MFTIGLKLTAARDYVFPIGVVFTSDDGYPNQRLELKFRTLP
ncbi:MAG: hypothetical protein ABJB66_16445 [Gemmatimonadaceae bacterium]